jgi:hypothetical protein
MTRRSGGCVRAVVAALLLAACGGSPAAEPAAGELPAQPPPVAVADGAEVGAAAQERARAALGERLPLADRSPNLLRGDFDGDGVADLVAVVRVGAGPFPAHVRVTQPWPEYGEWEEDGARQEVALAVIHGAPGRAGDVHLLRDPNPISILDAGAAHHLAVIPRAEAAALDAELARARGDVIVIPTEAGIDTYLFWDGSAYVHHAPLEIP